MNAKCSSNAHIPKRAYQGSAGYNRFAKETKLLKSWSRALIKLELSIAIPEGSNERIVGRSGLANTRGIIVHDGMIDLDIEVLCAWSFPIFPTRNFWWR